MIAPTSYRAQSLVSRESSASMQKMGMCKQGESLVAPHVVLVFVYGADHDPIGSCRLARVADMPVLFAYNGLRPWRAQRPMPVGTITRADGWVSNYSHFGAPMNECSALAFVSKDCRRQEE
eukprot:829589-Pelagomonas_calceolata.AAC.12